MKRREITMSISEFLEYTNQSKFERISNKILTNKTLRAGVVFSFAMALMMLEVQAATPDLSGIDRMGNTFLGIIQKAGYWITLTMGLVDIIRQVAKGGDGFSNIGKVIGKYVIIFASLYFMPYLFDVVKECFK